ncbi:MAG: hypothetical protein U5R31_03275 [Acidimicrobiia bacterium]|nr:hypothetical protein [Acidimicrobiia bacterium]
MRTLAPVFGRFLVIEIWAGPASTARVDDDGSPTAPGFRVVTPRNFATSTTVQALVDGLERLKLYRSSSPRSRSSPGGSSHRRGRTRSPTPPRCRSRHRRARSRGAARLPRSRHGRGLPDRAASPRGAPVAGAAQDVLRVRPHRDHGPSPPLPVTGEPGVHPGGAGTSTPPWRASPTSSTCCCTSRPPTRSAPSSSSGRHASSGCPSCTTGPATRTSRT